MKLLSITIIVQTSNCARILVNSRLWSAITAKSFAPFYGSLAYLSANEFSSLFLRGKKLFFFTL